MCLTILVSSFLHNYPWFWWVSITCVGLMRQCTHDWLKAEETCASIQMSYVFWESYFVSFFCLSLSVWYNFHKHFETLMEDLLKSLDGGYTLYSTRCFFTELLNNLSTWKWKYSTLPFILRTPLTIYSVNCYFSCFQHFFKDFVEYW